MSHFANSLNALFDGHKLTNEQLQQLLVELRQIETTLIGKGDIFYAARMVASSNLERVMSMCQSRGINSDPTASACPHCFKCLDVPSNVFTNIRSYHKSSLISSACCGKPVRISGQMRYIAEPSSTAQPEDDWGVPFKQ